MPENVIPQQFDDEIAQMEAKVEAQQAAIAVAEAPLSEEVVIGPLPDAPKEEHTEPAPITEAPVVDAPVAPPPTVEHLPDAGIPSQGPTAPSDIEQKYRTLQGKYDAEMPRLQADVRARDDALRAKDAEIESLKQSVSATQAVQVEDIHKLSDEEFQAKLALSDNEMDLGRDVLTTQYLFALRAAKESEDRVFENHVKPLLQTEAARREEAFLTNLGQQVPDYQAINANPQFSQWLTGARQQVLDVAVDSQDTATVVDLLNDFKAKHMPGETPAKTSLESQVMPPSGATVAQQHSPQPKDNYTEAQYDADNRALIKGEVKAHNVAEVEQRISTYDQRIALGEVRPPPSLGLELT